MNSDDYSLGDFIVYNDPDIFAKARLFQEYSEDYIQKEYYTYFRPILGHCGPRVKIFDRYTNGEREMLMMASNNYLGLSHRPEVVEAGKKALEKYGSSLGGSPLLCGYSDLHHELEQQLAAFKHAEDALIFPSGFSTNLGTISALLRKDDVILSDRLDHASIIDGCLFSRAIFRSFGHNDLEKLEKLLQKYQDSGNGRLVIVEGIYSMDGDLSHLDQIKALTDKYKARLMVDEAHATGVLGKTGAGSIEHFGLEGQIDLVIGTFSKTFGAMGGFVCASQEVINYIRFYARAYLFSASLSPVIVATVLKSLEILRAEPNLREKLWQNIHYMKNNLIRLGYNIGESESAIIPIMVGKDMTLRKMAAELHAKGLFINSVFYPAVPQDSARIRMSLMADHSQADMDEALDILEQTGKKFGII